MRTIPPILSIHKVASSNIVPAYETAEPNTTDPPVDPPVTGSIDDQTDPDPVKTEVSRETQNDGSIIITYSDGSTETIPAPLDPPKMKDESPTISPNGNVISKEMWMKPDFPYWEFMRILQRFEK